jgi:hypothetical protein
MECQATRISGFAYRWQRTRKFLNPTYLKCVLVMLSCCLNREPDEMQNCLKQIRPLLILSVTVILAIPVSGLAQQRPTAASQEFSYSSSPLVGGGQVTSQSIAGNPAQIITMVSGVPAPLPRGQVSATLPTSGRNITLPNGLPGAIPTPRIVNFQSPTLGMGLSRPRQLATDCDCKATQQTAYQPAAAVDAAPSLNVGVDSARYAIDNGNASTTIGAFEPTKFQNLPPGTYMGKSLFGKPKAYVDGEPVRNIFRFMSL